MLRRQKHALSQSTTPLRVHARVMDVRAENRGSHQKSAVFCGPGEGEKPFDPKASERKGQECPREIRTEKFMLCCFSSLGVT